GESGRGGRRTALRNDHRQCRRRRTGGARRARQRRHPDSQRSRRGEPRRRFRRPMMAQDSSIFWKRSRVELRAAGFDPDRAAKASAVVTIASAWTNAHRCNNRVRELADLLTTLVGEHGGQGLVVGAPAVSDALTQGTPTAGYSLVSRDTVADCFEIGHYAHHGDAMLVISGCDKTGAAALMPLARTNAV